MWHQNFNDKTWVLDGGFSSELKKHNSSFEGDVLWYARALKTDTEAVFKVHKSFLESGANIITTASYQASLSGFQDYLGVTFEESVSLMKSSVELAKKAKEEFIKSSPEHNDVLIAGSIGPYGAVLHDSSEYTGNYCSKMSHEELIEWHRPRVQCLVEAGVDILAFETIPASKEAEALMKLLSDFPECKSWLSFSCQTNHTNVHGENISDAVNRCLKLAPTNQLIAIGVNCCPPQVSTDLLKEINLVTHGFPLVVYPNNGGTWDSKLGTWVDEKLLELDSYVEKWIQLSAKIIGGCCCTTSEDIFTISSILKEKNIQF